MFLTHRYGGFEDETVLPFGVTFLCHRDCVVSDQSGHEELKVKP